MARQASICSLGAIADLYTFSAKAPIPMLIFDSVAVAGAENHWIGGQIIKIESDRFD
jgi:hypothetical protein